MNRGNHNIDLLFRNGLRDHEVLPPADVWASVSGVIPGKRKPFIFLRIAAALALLFSLGYLVSDYSLRNDFSSPGGYAVFEVNAADPYHIYPDENPAFNSIPKDKTTLAVSHPVSEILNVSDRQMHETVTTGPDARFVLFHRNLAPEIKNKAPEFRKSYLARDISSEIKAIPQIDNSEYEPSKLPPSHRWSIAALASPTYYSNINGTATDLSRQLQNGEQPQVSYSGGFALSYNISKRFSVESGLYYASLGQEVNGINSFSGFQRYDYTKGDHNFEVLTTSGTIFTNNSDVFLSPGSTNNRIVTNYTKDVFDPKKVNLSYLSSTLLQNFSYIELPVMLRYKIIDKTVGLNMSGGISYNMLVGNSVSAMVNGERYPVGTTMGVNAFTLSSSLGMGLEYNLSSRFSMNVEPTFRYYLNPFTTMPGVDSHPYSFGIFSGLSYKF